MRNISHSSHLTWWFLSGLTRPILVSSFSLKGSGSGSRMIGACSPCGSVTPEVEGTGSSVLQHLKIFCLSWCTLLMWFVRQDSDVHTFLQNLHWWTVPDTKPVGPLSMGFCLFPFCLVVPVDLSSKPIALSLLYSCQPAVLMPETILSKAVLPRPKSSSHFNIGYAPCVLHKIFCI